MAVLLARSLITVPEGRWDSITQSTEATEENCHPEGAKRLKDLLSSVDGNSRSFTALRMTGRALSTGCVLYAAFASAREQPP
jgi:hypothetical protein